MHRLQTVFSQVSLVRKPQDQDFERHLIFQEKKETYGDEKDSLDRKLRSLERRYDHEERKTDN
jgi:hypothetical protein